MVSIMVSMLTAKGAGAPPANAVKPIQARPMTERAAKVDAMRNLREQAYGVMIRLGHEFRRNFP